MPRSNIGPSNGALSSAPGPSTPSRYRRLPASIILSHRRQDDSCCSWRCPRSSGIPPPFHHCPWLGHVGVCEAAISNDRRDPTLPCRKLSAECMATYLLPVIDDDHSSIGTITGSGHVSRHRPIRSLASHLCISHVSQWKPRKKRKKVTRWSTWNDHVSKNV